MSPEKTSTSTSAPPVARRVQNPVVQVLDSKVHVPSDVVEVDVDVFSGDIPGPNYCPGVIVQDESGIHTIEAVGNRVVRDCYVMDIRAELDPIDVAAIERIARDHHVIRRDQTELASKELKASRDIASVE